MDDVPEVERDPRRWKQDGWIARVIRNEDGDGWAVSMTRVGDSEPSLTGPWTMGRDKVNPKPLDHPSFMALVKGASDVLRRHEAALRAQLHRSLTITTDDGRRVRVDLDIAQDEDDPHATVSVFDEATSELVRRARVEPTFKLSAATAARFLRDR